ncbi:hypothetical protein ACFVW1_09025 [Streptomyces olivochromogenes]|uniref:hypothetical protein n=1 Tax=Streptomyces olivochromogenes TaxID=1963 RepID=UPI0036DAF496
MGRDHRPDVTVHQTVPLQPLEGLGRQTGREIVYQPVTVEAYVDLLVGAGMPELYAGIMADADVSFSKGEMAFTSGGLSRLIGRPTTPIGDTVAAALKRPRP